MLFYGSGVNKLNSSIFILCPRWVETDFCRDETRREIFGTRRDRIQDKVSMKDAFKTSRDRTRQKSWVSRQDKTYGFFKISRRDGTRQHFPSRPGREIETRNFPTHHCPTLPWTDFRCIGNLKNTKLFWTHFFSSDLIFYLLLSPAHLQTQQVKWKP